MNSTIVHEAKTYIFLNGDFEKPADWPAKPEAEDFIIAADGGARHLKALGWTPHCLVGDFDSLEPEILTEFQALGTEICQHPIHKDEIDFELALGLARRRGHCRIEVLGALGGRWDMTFANIFLSLTDLAGVESIKFRHGLWTLVAATGPATLKLPGHTGDLLSLIPLSGGIGGITLKGCLYPLNNETLQAGLSRGLSNELTSPEASLSFDSGTLLVTHQGRASN